MKTQIDHITITAASLAAGVEHVHRMLGVALQAGGEHPRMGTHNCLLKLGAKLFLEVISINPAAPHPDRPRWFQLDDPDSVRTPRLATWIARTDDIHGAVTASPVPLGNVEPMNRGQLSWLITIPKDGGLPLQGLAPTLIQWPNGIHPADTLPDSGCSLIRLEGFHPQAERLRSVLEAIGFQGEFAVSAVRPGGEPGLVAHIQTPAGPRRLGSGG